MEVWRAVKGLCLSKVGLQSGAALERKNGPTSKGPALGLKRSTPGFLLYHKLSV